ncbi:MAG: hypothetical protein LBT95_09475 [Treponema sp.]|jgi:hypothetical protein|nr:hypothetical protein [Treponema sp.]
MKKNWKAGAFFAALVMTALPLPAETPEPLPIFPEPAGRVFPIIDQEEPFPQSGAGKVTFRNVTTDTDNFMSPFYFQLVNFENFFAFMGLTEGKFAAGYAGYWGSRFAGLYYHGNMLKQGELDEKASQDFAAGKTEAPVPGLGDVLSYSRREILSDNRAELLLGNSRGMALKVGFLERLIAGDGIPAPDAMAPQKSYSYLGGDIRPYLSWGMTLKAGKHEILPGIDLGVDFFRDSGSAVFEDRGLIGQAQQAAAGAADFPAYSFLKEESREGSMISPVFGAGFEWVSPLEHGRQTFGLKYSGGMAFYSNNYSVYGTRGNIKGSMTWKNEVTLSYDPSASQFINYTEKQTLTLRRISASRHTLTPVYRWFRALSERALLGVNVSVVIELRNLTRDETQRLTTHTQFLDPATAQTRQSSTVAGPALIDNYSSSALSVSPALNIGASYTAVPGVFTANAGLRVNLPRYVRTAIRGSRSVNIAGAFVPAGYTTDLTLWVPLGAEAAAGFVLNFSPNLAFDAMMSSGTIAFHGENPPPSSGEGIDLSRIALLLTLKF